MPIETRELTEQSQLPTMPTRSSITRDTAGQTTWRILLQIYGERHTTVGIGIQNHILLGRSIEQSDIDLDLGTFGGESLGVSRRHARISHIDQLLFLEDLASTNGTWLNNFTLQSHHLYRLKDGDEIYLGKLRMVIRLLKTPLVAS